MHAVAAAAVQGAVRCDAAAAAYVLLLSGSAVGGEAQFRFSCSLLSQNLIITYTAFYPVEV